MLCKYIYSRVIDCLLTHLLNCHCRSLYFQDSWLRKLVSNFCHLPCALQSAQWYKLYAQIFFFFGPWSIEVGKLTVHWLDTLLVTLNNQWRTQTYNIESLKMDKPASQQADLVIPRYLLWIFSWITLHVGFYNFQPLWQNKVPALPWTNISGGGGH